MAELDLDRLSKLLGVSEALAKHGSFNHLTNVVLSEVKAMNDEQNPERRGQVVTPAAGPENSAVDLGDGTLVDVGTEEAVQATEDKRKADEEEHRKSQVQGGTPLNSPNPANNPVPPVYPPNNGPRTIPNNPQDRTANTENQNPEPNPPVIPRRDI